MKASRAARLLAITMVAALVSTLSIGTAEAKSLKGTYTYSIGYVIEDPDGIISDSPGTAIQNLQTTYTYDISSIATNDLATFTFTVRRNGATTPLTGSYDLNSIMVDNKDIKDSLLSSDTPGEFTYVKVAGARKLSVVLIGQADLFWTSLGKAGRIGTLKMSTSVVITHRTPDLTNPGVFINVSNDAPIEITKSNSKVTDLKNEVGLNHDGKSAVLPENVTLAYGIVNWGATSTVAKGTKISVTTLSMKMKKPGSSKAKVLKTTKCTKKNNYCEKIPSNSYPRSFGLGASNRDFSQSQEAENTDSIKLKWATKNVYAYQNILIRKALPKGTTLTLSTVKVKAK